LEIWFWEDKWLGNATLREQYPALYSIVRHRGDTIAKVIDNSPPLAKFRRDLSGQRLVVGMPYFSVWQTSNYKMDTMNSVGTYMKMEFFLVASMYNALILPDVPIDKVSNDKLWKLKILLRIKVFGWYLRKGVVLTKDNIAKRNWHGSKKCVFCHQDETIKHLFFQCRFARSIWSVIKVASTLFPPCCITNIFGNWLNGIDNKFKKHIRVEAIAFIWSL
jgi:hypothetical protein